MALDLGNIPVYAVPSEAEQTQIREAIGINDNIGTSTAAALARRAVAGGVVSDGVAGYINIRTFIFQPDTSFVIKFSQNESFGSTQNRNFIGAKGMNSRWISLGGVVDAVRIRDDVSTIATGNTATNGVLDTGDVITLVFVWSGTDVTIYKNSDNTPFDTIDVSGLTQLSLTHIAAGYSPTEYAKMTIRDFTPFNTALTAAQALEIYNAGSAEAWLAENPEYQWALTEPSYDFTSGTDGWIPQSSATVTGGESIGGEVDALKVEASTSYAIARTPLVAAFQFVNGATYKITGFCYIPSSNTSLDSITAVDNISGAPRGSRQTPTPDTWEAFELIVDYPTTTTSYIRLGGYDEGTGLIVTTGDVVYFRQVTIEKLGALAHLPLTDDCRQLRDLSPNRYDAVASATGVTHLKQKEQHKFRDDNADGTGDPFLIAAADILAPNEVITGVIADGDYYAASGTQTDTYQRIQLEISGSDILVHRSNGTFAQTIATVTPASTTDFSITVLTSRY